MTDKVINYRGCFVCGQDNPAGLKLNFHFDPKSQKARTEFISGRQYEGYRGIIHGGIVSAVLDEVMIKAILSREILVVTSKLDVKFSRPAVVGEKLRFEGWITGQKGKAFFTEGQVINSKGQVVTEAKGIYLKVEGELAGLIKNSPTEE
ncbi:MAG: PaaI family thioesterase [Acidobacteriota bacterium]|nr:PaaI family thioesterase [Acidobacteriota bacterium]MDW3229971.1 PaaI family thioesterase [Acidobacteriota bacterium]MDY0231792.1 PaaI family thioesterase [Candidatus Saccharicenans sp.]